MASRITVQDDPSKATDRPTILQQMMDDLRTVQDAEGYMRQDMADDLEFFIGKGIWAPNVKSDREQDGRPCLVINRIPQFVNQVVNQIRAGRPAIQVNPQSGGARVEVAEALQGVIRSIEINSDADICISTAAEFQCICGRGALRIITEYAEDDGYEQILGYEEIPNPLLLFTDISTTDPRKKRFAILLEDMLKTDFREVYGEEAYSAAITFPTVRDNASEWMPEGRVRIANYYYVETTHETIADVEIPVPTAENPDNRETHQFTTDVLPSQKDMDEAGWKVHNSREIERRVVKYLRATPWQILEGNPDKTAGRRIPGRMIPVFELVGRRLNVNGKIDIRGMVRDGRDPARMISFWATSITEIIALSPRAPFIGYEGQFSGHTNKWNTANKRSYAYLEVKPITIGGQAAPLPQRVQFSPAIQAMVEAFQLADNDLKAVMGLYNPSLGAPGPEQSGKAILARQQQGEIGNSNYQYNVSKLLRSIGRYLLQAIPEVYAPWRIVRILGADGDSKLVMVHDGPDALDPDAMKAANGVPGIYDISSGRYDVTVTAGTEYFSRRQEAVGSMLELVKVYPQAAPIMADLIVKNMDWPGAQEVANRLRKAVPPQYLDDKEGGLSPAIQQHFQQMQEQYKELERKLESKVLDIQSREKVAAAQIDKDLKIAASGDQVQIVLAEMKKADAQRDRMFQQQMEILNRHLEAMYNAGQMKLDTQHQMMLKSHPEAPPAPPPADPGMPPAQPPV